MSCHFCLFNFDVSYIQQEHNRRRNHPLVTPTMHHISWHWTKELDGLKTLMVTFLALCMTVPASKIGCLIIKTVNSNKRTWKPSVPYRHFNDFLQHLSHGSLLLPLSRLHTSSITILPRPPPPQPCGIPQSFSWLASYWSLVVSLWWKWICFFPWGPRPITSCHSSSPSQWDFRRYSPSATPRAGTEWDERSAESEVNLQICINIGYFSISALPTPPKTNHWTYIVSILRHPLPLSYLGLSVLKNVMALQVDLIHYHSSCKSL